MQSPVRLELVPDGARPAPKRTFFETFAPDLHCSIAHRKLVKGDGALQRWDAAGLSSEPELGWAYIVLKPFLELPFHLE